MGGFHRVYLALAAVDDPLQHAQVVAEARPDEVPLVVRAEPVDVEDLRGLIAQLLAHLEPVREVVAHIVADRTGSIAIGSRRTTPTAPVAAAVVSDAMMEPTNTPLFQSRD